MMGLRERHKADRERRILKAAARLFRNAGYDGTKMERIAQTARVSIGTIYNYYQNKGDLLVAIVAMEVNEVLGSGARHIAGRHRSVQSAVDRLVAIYIEHSLVYLSEQMWQHAMAIATQQPDTPFGVIYAGLDARLARQVCELLDTLKSAGLLAEDVDTVAAGELIFNNLNMMFTTFVKTENMTVQEVLSAIARQHRVLLERITCLPSRRRPTPGRTASPYDRASRADRTC
ncbi:MAG: TetR/AcrR family transcriptional regulator [Hyphomicrobiaceae bacterium]